MKQQTKRNSEPDDLGVMQRLGASLADWSEKWFPDAYVFAGIAVAIVCAAALALGRSPAEISVDFGKSFWNLIPFTMQMAFVVIGGYIVAVSAPVRRVIDVLARFPKSPKVAVAYVACLAIVASLISWGFSMIFAGILMREISKRVSGVDYRAMGAAGYLGLGSVWALGLSSSAALLMATKGSIPPALLKVSGVIPLEQTLFTWQNLVMIVVLLVLSVWICYVSTPTAECAKTAEMAGIKYQEPEQTIGTPQTPGEKLEFSPALTVVIVALGIVYLWNVFSTKGGLAALDLNTYNFIFIIAGMLLHWRPRSFLRAAAKAIPMTGGVLLQFPLYAGIFAAILGLVLPSGGGKWVVEAPYLLEAANQLHVNLAWMVQVYNAAEALPNFINPFWMLPLMGLTGVKARDLAGYSTLQLIFHAPVVLIMLWLLGKTLPYVPPV